jgi:3-deoxy-manno-octulosonate cytidylyltransferase (CMP-KDO synthetase)
LTDSLPKIIGVIPARYDSSRFPGKPLINIRGKSMIMRVYEQAKKVKGLSDVIVATDDKRIADEVDQHGGHFLMTSNQHRNGTERCAEVLDKIDAQYVVNIQGDEPYIYPEQIESLISTLDGKTELATLIKLIEDVEQLDDNTTMKVLKNLKDEAIYFSRQCVPYIRDQEPSNWLKAHTFYKHIGIYAYRADILQQIVQLPPSLLELAESLEQLRWIENGYKIKLAHTKFESMSVDTPEDLGKLLKLHD